MQPDPLDELDGLDRIAAIRSHADQAKAASQEVLNVVYAHYGAARLAGFSKPQAFSLATICYRQLIGAS